MIVGEDFRFRDDLKKDTVPIELLLKPYANVVYRYTEIGEVKENKDGTATIKFQYELFDAGQHTETKLRKDKRFEKAIGLVLNRLILEAVQGSEQDDRKDDTQKSVETRRVREKSSTVRKK